jgi:flagellar basal body-associated protein FliL
LVLILVSISSFYLGQQTSAQPVPAAPLYVNIGDLIAFAGGKRLVKATVVVEVGGKMSQEEIAEFVPGAKFVIIKSIADFSEFEIATTDGKLKLQKTIRSNLNDRFDLWSIREVLFTDFFMSIS